MFNRTAEPVGHKPPYPRISIGMDDPEPGGLIVEVKSSAQICREITERHEQDRIWDLVKQTASGTCAPTSSPNSTDLLSDYDDTVCTDGWEAG